MKPSRLWAVSTREAQACTIQDRTNRDSAKEDTQRRIELDVKSWSEKDKTEGEISSQKEWGEGEKR